MDEILMALDVVQAPARKQAKRTLPCPWIVRSRSLEDGGIDAHWRHCHMRRGISSQLLTYLIVELACDCDSKGGVPPLGILLPSIVTEIAVQRQAIGYTGE